MKLNEIFTEQQYTEAYNIAKENNYEIIEVEKNIDDKGNEVRAFMLKEREIPVLTYVEQRLASYPPISEQLDMIYWDMINGTNNWRDLITSIKEQYPKI